MPTARIVIVGSGIFGVTAALTLAERGHSVSVIDPGPIPHPLAESTDISKIVRLDYGADESYMALMEPALSGFRRWNTQWSAPLFHETGVAFLCREPMAAGSFEYDSLRLLEARGHRAERLDRDAIRERFPAWNSELWAYGYFNPAGGWAESGRVVTALVQWARERGVAFHPGARAASLIDDGAYVRGVLCEGGQRFDADVVVLASGSWTPSLVPRLAPYFRSVGQPVFHLRPTDPERYAHTRFPVFGADIARTGYYGFCANQDGIVKIANHGVGRAMHPDSPEREVTADEESRFREFLAVTFPGLAAAPIVATRVCVYCDTRDEHFWIARDPSREGLVVASGGSGHGFKFAPVLGDLIADAVEGRENPALEKFRWREDATPGQEQARHHG